MAASDFDFGVGVDAFVEPGVFELVGGDHAVPVLVAELVFDGELGDVGWVVPAGVGGEEGWVLHAAHLGAGFGVDDGDDLVGVGTVALLEVREGLLRDVEVAWAGSGVRSEGEDVDLHGAEATRGRCRR